MDMDTRSLLLDYHLIIVTKMLMICVYLGVKSTKFQGEISRLNILLDFQCTDIIHSLLPVTVSTANFSYYT